MSMPFGPGTLYTPDPTQSTDPSQPGFALPTLSLPTAAKNTVVEPRLDKWQRQPVAAGFATVTSFADVDESGQYVDSFLYNGTLDATLFLGWFFVATSTTYRMKVKGKRTAGAGTLRWFILTTGIGVVDQHDSTVFNAGVYALDTFTFTGLTPGTTYFLSSFAAQGGVQGAFAIENSIEFQPVGGNVPFLSTGFNFVRVPARAEYATRNGIFAGQFFEGNPFIWDLNAPFAQWSFLTNASTVAVEAFAALGGIPFSYWVQDSDKDRPWSATSANLPNNAVLLDVKNFPATGLNRRLKVQAGSGTFNAGLINTTFMRAFYFPAAANLAIDLPSRVPLPVVGLGDSIMAGSAAAATPYRNYLAAMAQAKLPIDAQLFAAGSMQVNDVASSGALVNATAAAIVRGSPNSLFVNLGINDYATATLGTKTAALTGTRLGNLVTEALRRQPGINVAIAGLFPSHFDGVPNVNGDTPADFSTAYNNFVTAYAQPNVKFFAAGPGAGPLLSIAAGDFLGDQLHLSLQGEGKVARWLAQSVLLF